MKLQFCYFIIFITLFLTSCTNYISTMPMRVKAADPILLETLVFPEGYEILSVELSTSQASLVSGSDGGVSSSIKGRAFIYLNAKKIKSGERFLFIYENLKKRAKPIQIINIKEIDEKEFWN